MQLDISALIDRAITYTGYDRLRHARWRNKSSIPNVFGHRLYVDTNDIATQYFRLRNTPRLPSGGEFGFIAHNVKPGQTVIDAGANVGLVTLTLARLVGSGRVIAFEPGPKSHRLLLQNIEANGYRNIVAEHAALCDRSGTVDLYVCRTGESDNRIAGTIEDRGDRERHTISCFALDDYLAHEGIGPVHFVKID